MAQSAAGRPRAAARSLQNLLRRMPTQSASGDLAVLHVRALLALASVRFELVGPGPALELLDEAERRAGRLSDPVLLTLCHSQRATVLARSGQLVAALAQIEQAMPSVAALEPRDQVVLLLNRGTLLLYLGQVRRGADQLARATEAAVAAGLPREAFMSRCNEGYARYLTGDLPRALELLRDAEAESAEVSGSVVRLDRGRVLMEAGLLAEAREVLAEAVRLSRQSRQQQVLGEIELELARVHGLLGATQEGRRAARSARARFRRRGDVNWTARAELVLSQLALAADAGPRRVLRDTLAISPLFADGDPLLLAEHRLVLAEASLRCGDHEGAAGVLHQVEESAVRLPLREWLHLSLLRARLAVASGEPARARRVLAAASRRLVVDQAGSSSVDLRSAVSQHAVDLARLHVDLEVSRGARALFECSERWRAVTARPQPVLPPKDEELADRLARLREVREKLRQESDAEARQQLRAEEYRLHRSVRSRAWAIGAPGRAVLPQRSSYETVRSLLRDQERDLVTVLPQGNRFLAVALVGGRARVVDLSTSATAAETARRVRADLEVAGRHELGAFRSTVWSSLHAGMAHLDEAVIRPLGLGARPAVLVLPRSLAAAPWALAPSLQEAPFVVAHSAHQWARGAVATAQGPDSHPVVRCVAGPGLTHADAEVAAVAAAWADAEVITAERARMHHLRDALVQADVVHVAAHGTHHQHNPMFASVLLTGGPMFVYDLEHTGVRARHVVLSACEVGRSEVRAGDEAIGLAAGLLRLGAVSVVAGVSRLPDEVSARVMVAYHHRLRAGAAADEALASVVHREGGLAHSYQVMGSSWRSTGGPRADGPDQER